MEQDGFYERFGQRLAEMRRGVKPRLTQAVLAKRVGVSRSTIANIEKGRQRCPLHLLPELAHSLGCDPAALLPEESWRVESEVARELQSEGFSDAFIAQVARHLNQERTADEP